MQGVLSHTTPDRREDLHRQVQALAHTNWRCRAILHAMIDAGTLTKMECQLPECFMDNRAFDVQTRGRGHNAKGLVIDHIVPRLQGGSDRPENLRAIHATCNVARARGWKMTAEGRAKISEAIKARGGWKTANDKRPAGWNKMSRPDDHRADGNGGRARALTDEQVREARRRYAAGEIYRSIAADFGCSETPVMWAVRRLRTYADVA